MKRPTRHRRLTDEEIALWRAVAETVDARPGSILPVVPPLAEPPAPPRPLKADPPRPAPFIPAFSPKPQPRPAAPPLAPLERRYKQKVTRGRIDIERVMDLHGLSQAEAHSALRAFLRTAQRDGIRLVLVVTGKGGRGRSDPDGFAEPGILRRAVPHWLRESDLRAIVMAFEEAGSPHGGTGALYIRLRRPKDRD